MFEYNLQKSFAENFNAWYEMDRDERQQWGDAVLDRDEALKVFTGLYGHLVDSGTDQ